MEGGQGNTSSPFQVAQDVPCRRCISRPDLEAFRDRRCQIVNHSDGPGRPRRELPLPCSIVSSQRRDAYPNLRGDSLSFPWTNSLQPITLHIPILVGITWSKRMDACLGCTAIWSSSLV